MDLEDRNLAIFLSLRCFDAIVSLAACSANLQTSEILPVHCAKHPNGVEFVVVRIGIWRLTLPNVPFIIEGVLHRHPVGLRQLRHRWGEQIGDELPLPRARSLHITRRIGNNMCMALPRLCACMSEGKPPWGGGNCDTKTSTSGT